MEHIQNNLKILIEKMGFDDFSINYDLNGSRFSIFINDPVISKKTLPFLVADITHILRLIAGKNGFLKLIFVDINNYRKEREDLIIELARAAARKSVATQKDIFLPAMNAYERRLVHLELATRPDINTESTGDGKNRCVVIKFI